MPDFVTISGAAFKMLDFTRLPDQIGGKRQRTLSGQRRGDVLWRAREWAGTAYCATDVEASALLALADDVTPRVCAGEALPAGGVTCHVEHGVDAYVRKRVGWYHSIPLTFREITPS